MGVFDVVLRTDLRARSWLAQPALTGTILLVVEPPIDLTGCDVVLVGGLEDAYFTTYPGFPTQRIVLRKETLRRDYPVGTEVVGGHREQFA